MSMYRKEWDCCGDVSETNGWEPETCPFCATTPAPSTAPEVPPFPESFGLADVPHAMNTPDDWDADYRATWQKLQVAEINLSQMRAYARKLRAALASRPAEVDDWISVDDRLPELQKEVLICCGYLVLGYRTDDKHDPENHKGWVIDFDNGSASAITHWRPLPAAPSHTTNKEK